MLYTEFNFPINFTEVRFSCVAISTSSFSKTYIEHQLWESSQYLPAVLNYKAKSAFKVYTSESPTSLAGSMIAIGI